MGSVGPSGGPSGLRPEAATSDPEPRPHDAALRSTLVDKEEAAMLRAMARLNGDEQKSRGLGNRYSQKNVAKQRARAQEAAAMGLSAMDPPSSTSCSASWQRATPRCRSARCRCRVGLGARRQRPALIDIIPHRKAEDEIREEFDNLGDARRAPRRRRALADDKKDELALRNQFYGRTPQEVLAAAPPKAPAAAARRRPRHLPPRADRGGGRRAA